MTTRSTRTVLLGVALAVGAATTVVGVGAPVPVAVAAPSDSVPASDDGGSYVMIGSSADAPSEPSAAPGADAPAPAATPYVIGGTASGALPWMAVLFIQNASGSTFRCGGTLIAPSWVMTAAHCLADTNASAVGVAIGRTVAPTSLSDPANIAAAAWYVNENYVTVGTADIALVELSEPSSATPITLATSSDDDLVTAGTMARVAGFGVTGEGTSVSPVLLRADLPIRSTIDCLAEYFFFNPSTNLCAGYVVGEADEPAGACQGDSGGPLLVGSVQVGIVSWGRGVCTSLDAPGGYMRVSFFSAGIYDFIDGTTDPPTPPPPPPPPTPTPSPTEVEFERWAGADRYTTSVRISQEGFPDGADTVFLATGESFPDALTGGPAAAMFDAPILLTRTDELPPNVLVELRRLDPSTIYLLGGPAAISTDVEDEVEDEMTADVRRVAGSDRYATAADIAELGFPTADVVYVVAGTGFADALSAGPPGGVLERPVLLTTPDGLPPVSQAQITRLADPDVVVLGGPAAVSDVVLAELVALTSGSVRRVSGDDRYATSVAVSADAFADADTVFLATGVTFPDALSAAPVAADLLAPILLTRPTCVPADVVAEIGRLGAEQVVTLGGPAAVSDDAAELTACTTP